MNRKIIIKDREGRFDVPLFTLSNNETLRLEIVAPPARNGVYYFTAKHGEEKARYVLSGRLFVEFSSEWLQKGGNEPILCELELRDRTGTVIYKRYPIEPLEIEVHEVDATYYAQVQALKKICADLQSSYDSMREEIRRIRQGLGEVPGLIEQAKKEAIIDAMGGDMLGA